MPALFILTFMESSKRSQHWYLIICKSYKCWVPVPSLPKLFPISSQSERLEARRCVSEHGGSPGRERRRQWRHETHGRGRLQGKPQDVGTAQLSRWGWGTVRADSCLCRQGISRSVAVEVVFEIELIMHCLIQSINCFERLEKSLTFLIRITFIGMLEEKNAIEE